MNFGFIGVGQAGGNMVNSMREFPCLVVNTAMQDLADLNISNDYKIFTKVSAGGAGKNIAIGEKAILEYRNILIDRIRLVFNRCDYLWIVAGLGGGTGSLGCVQIVSILNELNINHGVICTLPMREEGTHEKINAVLAANQLKKAQEQTAYFRSLIFIDNDKLKEKMILKENLPYEQLWQQSNELIFGSLKKLIAYTEKSSMTSFDPEDFRRVLLEKGILFWGEGEVDIDPNSDIFLINKVKDLWMSDLFITGEITQATGCVVLLERPNNYDKDSKAIDILFKQVKEEIKSGFIAKGIYSQKGSITDTFKSKKIKIFTILSGMPFPINKINDLAVKARSELDDIKEKKSKQEIEDITPLLQFLKDENSFPKQEKVDLCLFNLGGIDI